MNFKDVKSGFPIHILNKGNMTYEVQTVKAVSMPHVDAKVSAVQMVVDITTDSSTYCMLADTDVAYPSDKVIATDKAVVLREVEAARSVAEQALAQMENHKQTVTRCNELLAELDPVAKEKQQNEQRFASIEDKIDRMSLLIEKIVR